MKISLDDAAGLNLISAYADGQVTIRGQQYATSLLVFPHEVIPDWPTINITMLDKAALSNIIEKRPEVFLLGTGKKQIFPDLRELIPLIDNQIGYEIMDNAAACRTYNILLSEGRNAALALLSDL